MLKNESNKPRLPISPNLLFGRLKSLLGSYRAMQEVTGVSISTLESWCVSAPLDPVRALLRLLSAIPFQQRIELLRAATLPLPAVDHEYLSGNRFLSKCLADIAGKDIGISLIIGESAYLRSFMAIAIANSARANGLEIWGYDIHDPSWFLPLAGVRYLRIEEGPLTFDFDWTVPPEGTVGVLNGVWSLLTESQRQSLIKMSVRRHIVLADRGAAFASDLKGGSDFDAIHVARNPATPIGADEAQHMKVVIQSGCRG